MSKDPKWTASLPRIIGPRKYALWLLNIYIYVCILPNTSTTAVRDAMALCFNSAYTGLLHHMMTHEGSQFRKLLQSLLPSTTPTMRKVVFMQIKVLELVEDTTNFCMNGEWLTPCYLTYTLHSRHISIKKYSILVFSAARKISLTVSPNKICRRIC